MKKAMISRHPFGANDGVFTTGPCKSSRIVTVVAKRGRPTAEYSIYRAWLRALLPQVPVNIRFRSQGTDRLPSTFYPVCLLLIR
jgi:hypothetical protein